MSAALDRSVDARARQVRSLAWLRPTGQFYSNPAMLAKARKRRHALVPPESYFGSAKRAAHAARVRSPRTSHRSPPRQNAKTKHARGSPKAARRAVTTDRRQRAAAAAFVVGTPCENCGQPMQRCFGSGRFCGQTCASKFSRVGPSSELGSTKSSGTAASVPYDRLCEACGGPVLTIFGSGRFCKRACAARFSRIGSKSRANAALAASALKPVERSQSVPKPALQEHSEMEVDEVQGQSTTVSVGAEKDIAVDPPAQLSPADV